MGGTNTEMTNIMQNVLEKFEFFPIKCRVQRSLENFKRTWKGNQTTKGQKTLWNQKVQILFILNLTIGLTLNNQLTKKEKH